MKILYSNDSNFKQDFDKLVNRSNLDMQNVMETVNNIISDIKEHGDEALNEQIFKFDKWKVNGDLQIERSDMENAYNNLDPDLKKSLSIAYERIKIYHEKQLEKTWLSFED
ncbi:histidinol dehydrogenase, partial [Campylobacter fetus]